MFDLISWLIFGLLVGFFAKVIHPGNEPVGFLPTVLIGVVGSYVGGLISWLISAQQFAPAGFIMSIIGGVICCAAWRWYILKYSKTGNKSFFSGKNL
jgi:uncharacterized membrane protein YeaQ/YmgE (transglycosylase-associated protein family)